MHTDPLFYRIFQERPATVFELAGLAVPPPGAYRMHAEEVKQTAFRLDGVLLPDPGTPGLPLVFAESQFYADPWFYARWLASIFLYLFRQRVTGPWRAVVVFPDRSFDIGETRPYDDMNRGGTLHRVYLEDLLGRPGLGPGARLARLVVMDREPLLAEARALIDEQTAAGQREATLDLIETVLVYKFPLLSRQEIQIMLHLPVSDLKKTRFYQEVFREGAEQGEKRGEKRGAKRGVLLGQLALVRRQLQVRVGTPTPEQQARIERLSADELGALGEALLDFTGPEDLDRWLRGSRG
jgi:predicted transposase YdaD